MKNNRFLIIAGISSGLVSLLHIAIIFGGADWYRFFGAGEGMAQLAEQGSNYPPATTALIAFMLALSAIYAFSGAGIIKRLPFLKLVLVIISSVYILRGALGIPIVIFIDDPYLNELEGRLSFMIISSFISLSFGLLYLIGLIKFWKTNINHDQTTQEAQ
jgi:hypothetical protein